MFILYSFQLNSLQYTVL